MKKPSTTVRVDIEQRERAKKLNKTSKEIFEDGLIANENKDQEYNKLLNDLKNLEDEIISQKAKIENKRRELRKISPNFKEAINDVLKIWEDSKKDLETFCNDEIQYLAKVMGNFEKVKTLKDLKDYLTKKKNF